MQARQDVGPGITDVVVSTVGKVHEVNAMGAEVHALVKYVEHVFQMREVMKQQKLWEDDRQAKVTEAIAKAMKEWDDEHYPRLLQATWGWHPFYTAFVANPLCFDFRPPYPLSHSIVEGSDVHEMVLQRNNVTRIYHVPWSVLLIRCFLTFHTNVPPVVSHPTNGQCYGVVKTCTRSRKLGLACVAAGNHVLETGRFFSVRRCQTCANVRAMGDGSGRRYPRFDKS